MDKQVSKSNFVEIKKWFHKGVDPNGNLSKAGKVDVFFDVKSSLEDSCSLSACNCVKSAWICVNFGLQKNGTVRGYTVYFKDELENSIFVQSN